MNGSREAIYSALFALVGASASFVTSSRRTQLINEVQPSQMPAIYMQQVRETVIAARPYPSKYTLRVDLALYAQNPDASQSAAPQLNALVDAVEDALAPIVPGQNQTLGGLVSHCYVAGEVEFFEGNLGSTAGAVIPVEIVTT